MRDSRADEDKRQEYAQHDLEDQKRHAAHWSILQPVECFDIWRPAVAAQIFLPARNRRIYRHVKLSRVEASRTDR